MRTSSSVLQNIRAANVQAAKLRIGIIVWAGVSLQLILFLIIGWVAAVSFEIAKMSLSMLTVCDALKVLAPATLFTLVFHFMLYRPTLLKEQKSLELAMK